VNSPRLDSRFVETVHDESKHPHMVCAFCWDPIEDGARIVGQPIVQGSPRWSNRAWHYEEGRNCFNRKFPDRVPRQAKFTPLVHS